MQYVQVYNDFDFDVQMGTPAENMREKYGLSPAELLSAMEFYHQGNTLELEKLLGSKTVAAVAVDVEPEIVIEEEAAKPEYGYIATPRHSFMFVKPTSPEHKGRLITPKAYESTSDQGFVHAVGPDVLDVKVGDLVLFDRYAEVGNRFELVDEEGDVVQMIQMREDNCTAILQRVKTKYAND